MPWQPEADFQGAGADPSSTAACAPAGGSEGAPLWTGSAAGAAGLTAADLRKKCACHCHC